MSLSDWMERMSTNSSQAIHLSRELIGEDTQHCTLAQANIGCYGHPGLQLEAVAIRFQHLGVEDHLSREGEKLANFIWRQRIGTDLDQLAFDIAELAKREGIDPDIDRHARTNEPDVLVGNKNASDVIIVGDNLQDRLAGIHHCPGAKSLVSRK